MEMYLNTELEPAFSTSVHHTLLTPRLTAVCWSAGLGEFVLFWDSIKVFVLLTVAYDPVPVSDFIFCVRLF